MFAILSPCLCGRNYKPSIKMMTSSERTELGAPGLCHKPHHRSMAVSLGIKVVNSNKIMVPRSLGWLWTQRL